MSHLNYNHLYYFWHVYKQGSVVGAAEALYLTPQTITGQIKALEERLQGKLFKRKGRGIEPSELGELVFRYADKMFTLSQEMLDIVNYRKESNLLFDVGVADALSKRLVSGVLDAAVVEDEQIHLRCFESTHEMLLEQLSQHKLDMIISDCPIDSTQQEGLFSVKIGECGVSFWCINPPPEKPFPACLEERRLLVPGRRSMLGRKLGELVFRYADKMFTLSQEMLDIVNYRKESNLLFDVGVADALSKRLVSGVLDAAVVEDEQIHLRCFESTHEMLLEQLSQHKLDMIISDCPIDSTQQEGLFSVKIGECGVSFWCINPPPEKPFPACLEERRLLVPGRRSMLGRKLLNWFNSQGLNVEILGEFDDAALMKAFGEAHNAIFVAPTLYAHDLYSDDKITEIGRVDNVMEEYHAIFAERMIQHPAVQRICNRDYSALFTPPAI